MSTAKNKKSLNKITLLNILSTFLIQGISIITAPIISRLLGTANYGIVSIYSTWVSIATILFSLQTQSTLNVARTEYPESEQIKYQSSLIFLSLLVFFVSTVLIGIFSKPLAAWLRLEPLMLILMMMVVILQLVPLPLLLSHGLINSATGSGAASSERY